VDVRAAVSRLQPGFHAFHVHAVGSCVGPDFKSAMGHLKEGAQSHGAHAGDMSSMLVKGNGTTVLRLTTDRFTLADLADADGSAVMVHAGPDNFGNIPPRYAPDGPDQETRDTGDSGARVACGEVK
jgi:Cu-Zn family superoxide dismutase